MQIHQVFGCLQPFLLQLIAKEDQLQLPPPLQTTELRMNEDLTPILPPKLVDLAEVLKYKFIRVIAPYVNLHIEEAACQLHLQVSSYFYTSYTYNYSVICTQYLQ